MMSGLLAIWIGDRLQSVVVSSVGQPDHLGNLIRGTRSQSRSVVLKCTFVVRDCPYGLFLVHQGHSVGLWVCCCVLSHVAALCVKQRNRCSLGGWLEVLSQSRRSI